MHSTRYLEEVDEILSDEIDDCPAYRRLLSCIKGSLLAAVKYLFRIGELT